MNIYTTRGRFALGSPYTLNQVSNVSLPTTKGTVPVLIPVSLERAKLLETRGREGN
jgi:hypothetical protein